MGRLVQEAANLAQLSGARFETARGPAGWQGDIQGSVIRLQQGTCYQLTLVEAGTQTARSDERRAVHIAVVQQDGRLRAWAVAGKINAMSHEVDASSLSIKNGRLHGMVTVIFRDDPYFHLNGTNKTGVAATYRIDATINGAEIKGSHSGAFGHEWSRSGTVTGRTIGR